MGVEAYWKTARHKHKKAKVSGKGKRRSQFNGGSHTAQLCHSTLISTLATGNAGGNDEGRTDEVSCLPTLPIADDDEIFSMLNQGWTAPPAAATSSSHGGHTPTTAQPCCTPSCQCSGSLRVCLAIGGLSFWLGCGQRQVQVLSRT